jgi:gliding motility-associated-like protein
MSGTYIVQGFSQEECHYLLTDSIRIYVYKSRHFDAYDTIVENQLPWSQFDTLFYGETDTVFIRSYSPSSCDSIYNYHLRVFYNVEDTVLYYSCESDLPVQYDTAWFSHDGEEGQFIYPGSHGEDSIVTFILHVIPNRDTILYDTILENQLPWFVLDTVFNDTVADYIFRTVSAEGCDSLVHYNLFIFWDGDHCDTSLTYPNVVTPNGDGMNDRFVIGGLLEHHCFKYNELLIYDRTGRCIYHKHNIASESDWWDPAGQHAPSGTYFFYFKAHGVNIWTQHFGVIEVLREK